MAFSKTGLLENEMFATSRRLSVLVNVPLFLLLLAGCAAPAPARDGAPSSSSAQAAPKRITAALMGDPPTTSVKVTSSGGGSIPGQAELEEMVNAGLTQIDNLGAVRPVYAEAAPSVENGLWTVAPDGRMETTWRIRDGARWHDGTPLTANDLVFTTQVGRDADIPNFSSLAYRSVESVDAVDPRTVRVKWNRPFVEADMLFGIADSFPMPRHLLERAYVEDKTTLHQLPYWGVDYVGLGPYRVGEWVPGSHLLLHANPDYPLGRPKIDVIELKFIPDSSTLGANILAGTVELTMGRNLSLEQAAQIRDQWRDGRMEARLSNWLVMFPQFLNPSPAVISSVQFRRALLHATDRQQMVDTLEGGLSFVGHSLLSPNQAEFKEIEERLIRYEYDPRKAADMITALGYTKAADGMFRDASGQRLSVEVRTTADNDIHRSTLTAVADYWQRAGVGVEQVIVPIQRQRDREYRANFPGFDMLKNPNDIRALQRLHSSESRLPENNYVGANYARYMVPEFDAMLDRYFVTIPKRERIQALGEIIHHVSDQLNVMGLFYDTEPLMIGNRLRNVASNPIPRSSPVWAIYEWDVARL